MCSEFLALLLESPIWQGEGEFSFSPKSCHSSWGFAERPPPLHPIKHLCVVATQLDSSVEPSVSVCPATCSPIALHCFIISGPPQEGGAPYNPKRPSVPLSYAAQQFVHDPYNRPPVVVPCGVALAASCTSQ
jgi:hypothetical protein